MFWTSYNPQNTILTCSYCYNNALNNHSKITIVKVVFSNKSACAIFNYGKLTYEK